MSNTEMHINIEVLYLNHESLLEAATILELFDTDYHLFKEIEREECTTFSFNRNNSTIGFWVMER